MYRQKSLAMSQTVRKLTQIYIHPEYIADTFDNDIGKMEHYPALKNRTSLCTIVVRILPRLINLLCFSTS